MQKKLAYICQLHPRRLVSVSVDVSSFRDRDVEIIALFVEIWKKFLGDLLVIYRCLLRVAQ